MTSERNPLTSFVPCIAEDERGWGYSVFGRVMEGMEVVEKISRAPT